MLILDIVEAARAIRPLLGELLGSNAAVAACRLDSLLTQDPASAATCDDILDLFASQESTRLWILDYLNRRTWAWLYVATVRDRLEELVIAAGHEWPKLRRQLRVPLDAMRHGASEGQIELIRTLGLNSAAREKFVEIDQFVAKQQETLDVHTRATFSNADWRHGGEERSSAHLDQAAGALLEFLDPPRSAYGLLECPGVLVGDREFALTVGLAPDPVPSVAGLPISRAAAVGPYVLTVEIVAAGFRSTSGDTLKQALLVTARQPYPRFVARLIPEATSSIRPALIQAFYSIAGQTAGLACRSVTVVPSDEYLGGVAPKNPILALPLTFPDEESAADLEVRIIDCGQGRLRWTFETPWPIERPVEPIETSIGDNAKQFAEALVNEAASSGFIPGDCSSFRGMANTIRDHMPDAFWQSWNSIADRVPDRPPSILFLTSEPYVPWELAFVDRLLNPHASPFLSAQARVGRWILPMRMETWRPRPKLPPPRQTMVESVGTVSGEYDSTSSDQKSLKHAREEVKWIAENCHGHRIDATQEEVLLCLQSPPSVIHFALHGVHDPKSLRDGLLLADGTVLRPSTIKGAEMDGHPPFVFLNACQAAATHKMLSGCAGVAESFLYIGATGVVAPLWSVDDDLACQIALAFYKGAQDGVAPAEVLRRLRTGDGDDRPMALASLSYVFFGHPEFRLVWSSGPKNPESLREPVGGPAPVPE